MSKLSKAKRVRDYLEKNSDAGPAEVAAALSKYKVTAAYVSNIKTELRKKSGLVSRRNKIDDSNLDHLKAAGVFIKSCGSLERAKEVLKATTEIVEILKS